MPEFIPRVVSRETEMTRRITDADALSIDIALSKLVDVDKSIKALVSAVNAGEWNNPSIDREALPHIALLAYQEELLTTGQFSTLLMAWSAWKMSKRPLRPITLYDNKKEYIELISKNLQFPSDCKLDPEGNLLEQQIRHSHYLDEEQITFFLEVVSILDKSDQVVFIINHEDNDLISQDSVTILQALTSLNFTIFSNMVVPLKMMQWYLNIKFGPQAVTINPVLGSSSVGDIIESGKKGQRDLALHFPGVYLPEIADGVKAPWFQFTFHDWYHGFAVSAIPREDRSLMFELYDAVQDFLKKRNEGLTVFLTGFASFFPLEVQQKISQYSEVPDTAAIQYIADALIDMEHSYYRIAYSAFKTQWVSLELFFIRSLLESLNKPNPNDVQLLENSKTKLLDVFCKCILKSRQDREDIVNCMTTLFPPISKESFISTTNNVMTKEFLDFGQAWNRVSPCFFAKRVKTLENSASSLSINMKNL